MICVLDVTYTLIEPFAVMIKDMNTLHNEDDI
jgi:hypothetical protein